MAGSDEARRAPAIDVGRSLAALAAALPRGLSRGEELGRRIQALEGDTETVESELARIDLEMVEEARTGLGEEQRTELARRVEAGLGRVGSRLSAEELRIARRRLEAQVLRRLLDLPLLSLFSPQARDEETG